MTVRDYETAVDLKYVILSYPGSVPKFRYGFATVGVENINSFVYRTAVVTSNVFEVLNLVRP
eukprot:SAG31_NODE_17799_length_657_cov_1.163082_1_plen_62_part_00